MEDESHDIGSMIRELMKRQKISGAEVVDRREKTKKPIEKIDYRKLGSSSIHSLKKPPSTQ